MDKLWMALPGAALSGLGAALGALGFRLLRVPSTAVAVGVFAGAGAAIGATMGFPTFAAGLCVVGAFLGLKSHALLARATVGLAAATGGAAIGLLLGVIFTTSHPVALALATATGATVVAFLDDRRMAIAWTSAAGAALVVHGLLRSTAVFAGISPTQRSWTLAILFAVFTAAGVAFQLRSTAEEQVPTTIAPVAPPPASA